jgi:hypothetical protein
MLISDAMIKAANDAAAKAWRTGENMTIAMLTTAFAASTSGGEQHTTGLPDGWQLVPIEPTVEMARAANMPWESPRFPDRWKAMIAATPSPPAAVQEPVVVKADEPMTWRNMSTAPKDGKHCILAVKEGAFIYSVQGAFHAGQWNAVHRGNVEPLCWMPNIRLPTNFSALSTPQSDPAPETKLSGINTDLLKALKYVRRFLNPEDHDVSYVDDVIDKAEGRGLYATTATEGE